MSERASSSLVSLALLQGKAPLADLLARLEADLTMQRGELSEWRGRLACQSDIAGELSQALMDYRAELADLGTRLVRLSHRARQLETMARLKKAEGAAPFSLVPQATRSN